MKRLFDIFFSLWVLLVLGPFLFVISLIIAFSSKGGVFYIQKRVGKNNVDFGLIKFRTMRLDADKMGKITVGMRDPRITKIGYFLRRFKIDELPQFINVFLGQMSIVGPRPEVREYVDLYNQDQKRVLSVPPGITDFASLKYFKENELLGNAENPQKVYVEEVMPEKLRINLEYVETASFGTDIKIIWLTFKRIVFGK